MNKYIARVLLVMVVPSAFVVISLMGGDSLQETFINLLILVGALGVAAVSIVIFVWLLVESFE